MFATYIVIAAVVILIGVVATRQVEEPHPLDAPDTKA